MDLFSKNKTQKEINDKKLANEKTGQKSSRHTPSPDRRIIEQQFLGYGVGSLNSNSKI